jgi:glucokinase
MDQTTRMNSRAAGVSVSNDRLLAVLLEPDGTMAGDLAANVESGTETVAQLREFVSRLRGELGDFGMLGVAVPGLVNRAANRVEYSAEFPAHAHADLATILGEASETACVIENDANAGGYGEFRAGAGRGAADLFYATLGSGVGGCIIFDGEIWRGDSGFAGEFGYVTINSDGMRLEDVASAGSIVRRTLSRIHQDRTSVLSGLDEQTITIADIASAARNEDDFAVLMLERTGRYVGSAIAGVINLLNIERIVIGGAVMESGPVMLESITARAKEFSFGPAFAGTSIRAGELGDKAAAIGAALIAGESETSPQ